MTSQKRLKIIKDLLKNKKECCYDVSKKEEDQDTVIVSLLKSKNGFALEYLPVNSSYRGTRSKPYAHFTFCFDKKGKLAGMSQVNSFRVGLVGKSPLYNNYHVLPPKLDMADKLLMRVSKYKM